MCPVPQGGTLSVTKYARFQTSPLLENSMKSRSASQGSSERRNVIKTHARALAVQQAPS